MNVIADEPIYDIITWFNFPQKNEIFPKVEICANYLSGRVISYEIDEFAKYVDSHENSPKAEISEEKIVHVYDE